eukprot:scaffold111202_cov62-Phaeocystis_antarctica.AAC.4
MLLALIRVRVRVRAHLEHELLACLAVLAADARRGAAFGSALEHGDHLDVVRDGRALERRGERDRGARARVVVLALVQHSAVLDLLVELREDFVGLLRPEDVRGRAVEAGERVVKLGEDWRDQRKDHE